MLAEWTKALALKASEGNASVGSNPTHSVGGRRSERGTCDPRLVAQTGLDSAASWIHRIVV
jgi:hypothetical protein